MSKTAPSSIGVFRHPSRTPRRYSRDIEMLGFLHAGRRREINHRVPSELWRLLCFCSTVRSASASGGAIVARSYTPNDCARYALGPGKIRMFQSSKLVATVAILLCFSFAGQAETIQHRSHEPTGAGHHYIVQPRSSRVTTRGHPRTRQAPSGAAGHSYAHSTFSQPTAIHGTFAAPRWW